MVLALADQQDHGLQTLMEVEAEEEIDTVNTQSCAQQQSKVHTTP
jgi:hypothetical protein